MIIKKHKPIRKAVFPVGGLGTRFLPVTKSLPKEMLPVNCKPLIQHVFEEAYEAGIEQFIFITGRNKNAINNHFDHSYELQQILTDKDKQQELLLTKSWLPKAGQVAFIRQQEPLGLGHAIWCARNLINDEPFIVLLADEILLSKKNFISQMIDYYNQVGNNIIALAEIEPHLTHHYGIIEPYSINDEQIKIKSMIEKPLSSVAPSNLSITGRYILQPEIFAHLGNIPTGFGGEIQLTDAMQSLIKNQEFHGLKFQGRRFDCGSQLGFLEANIAYALLDKNNQSGVIKLLHKYINELTV